MPSEFGDGLFVSASQIKTYLRCPRLYELRYVRGEKPAFVPVALAFGGAIHTALGYGYGMLKLTSSLPALPDIEQVFVDAWTNGTSGPLPLQAEEEDAAVDHIQKGKEMLAIWYSHLASNPLPEVVEVELPFLVDLHDPITGEVLDERLAGVIDLVVREGDQRVIVEHKTAARRYSEDQLRHDLQPTAYLHAAQALGFNESLVRFQILTKAKTPALQIATVRRSTLDTEDFLLTVIGVLRSVEARAFYPVRGWQCRTCPYAAVCSPTEATQS